MVFEWIAMIVAFGIFFGTIIEKYIEHCSCCSDKDKTEYEHLKSE